MKRRKTKKKMWNKKISDMLSEFAEGVKNGTYQKMPYTLWRELREQGENYGSIELEFNFANPDAEDRTKVFLKNQKGKELCEPYAMDGSFGSYLFNLYQKWRSEELKKSTDRMKESFAKVAETAKKATANWTITSAELANTAKLDDAIVYGVPQTGVSAFDSGPCIVEVNSDYFKVNGKTIKEMVEELVNKNEKKEEKKDMDLFKNFDFGSCENDKVKVSMYGIAVQNPTGTWVSYDSKSGKVVDVDILNFSGKYLYKMPVAIKDIKESDVIIHNRKPMFVTRVEDGKLLVIDPAAGEEKIVLPTTNMFGFNFAVKIVNLFGNCFGSVSADQPFGNMLPLMMLADGGKTDDVLPLMFLMNGGGNFDMSNPMMLYFLMKDGKSNDMLPLMMMCGQGAFTFGKTNPVEDCDRASAVS